MNRAQRTELNEIAHALAHLIAKATKHVERVESIVDEADEALENTPDNLRYSGRGEQAEDELNSLRESFDDLKSTLTTLSQAAKSLTLLA